ncbi:MAG: acyltransferase [Bacteroidetes bacterium]|nr:acyltransferase [Bacteroidota bacterium]
MLTELVQSKRTTMRSWFGDLKVFRTINSPDRISSVDIFRSLAIIPVVLYHFNYTLYLGNLGVDLFFVISGLLIGGLLTRQFRNNDPIHFRKFFLQRGFKIWPSYYFFLLVGGVLVYIMYRHSAPDELMSRQNLASYIFFYRNYTIGDKEWSFGHTWSLCVEEFFYLLLPLLYILSQRAGRYKKGILVGFVLGLIFAGIIFKVLAVRNDPKADTYFATHMRIDALAWGVLLSLIIAYSNLYRSFKYKYLLFIAGAVLLVVSIKFYFYTGSVFYKKVVFRSGVPACFFLMLAGLYYTDFSRLKPLSFIAYFSYNWYLWHPIFSISFTNLFGKGLVGAFVYALFTFCIAVAVTIVIEEPFLRWRKQIIK